VATESAKQIVVRWADNAKFKQQVGQIHFTVHYILVCSNNLLSFTDGEIYQFIKIMYSGW